METSINSHHGQVSWASLFRPTQNITERNISIKKTRKGFREKSRKSHNFKESEHKLNENKNSIDGVKMSPRNEDLSINQPMRVDAMISKKILKLSDVQINQKLELGRSGKISIVKVELNYFQNSGPISCPMLGVFAIIASPGISHITHLITDYPYF